MRTGTAQLHPDPRCPDTKSIGIRCKPEHVGEAQCGSESDWFIHRPKEEGGLFRGGRQPKGALDVIVGAAHIVSACRRFRVPLSGVNSLEIGTEAGEGARNWPWPRFENRAVTRAAVRLAAVGRVPARVYLGAPHPPTSGSHARTMRGLRSHSSGTVRRGPQAMSTSPSTVRSVRRRVSASHCGNLDARRFIDHRIQRA